MTVLEQGPVWGGLTYYNMSVGIEPLNYLVDFFTRLREDPKGMSYATYTWDTTSEEYIILMPHIYLEPVAYPSPLFDELREIPAVNSTLQITNLLGVADDIDSTNAIGSRNQWSTFMFAPDAQAGMDLFTSGQEIFEPLINTVDGFSWGLTFQPIASSVFEVAASRDGGNPSGLTNSTGDLFCEYDSSMIDVFC
jgi:hypothetical protein